MDFLNLAIEQSKKIQQQVADALAQGTEAAKPLVADAVSKAQDLQKTLLEQAPGVTAATQQQLNTAMQHAGDFIAAGKSVLEAGVSGAAGRIQELQEQAKKTSDATVNAAETARAETPPQG